MPTPFISICIPAYHRPDLLTKLLDSISFQSFRDFEIIIADNSTNDSVAVVAKKFQPVLPLQYIKNVPTITATQNTNKLITLARAPWVKLMHDDDWFHGDDALQKFVLAAEKSGRDFIFSSSNQVELRTNKSKVERLEGRRLEMINDSYYSLFYLNLVGHPSVVMHRKDTSILYDEQFKWVQDIDFYLRYFKKHGPFEYVPEALVNIGKGPTQESHLYYKNPTVELPEYLRMLSKYPADLPIKNRYVFHLLWNMIKRYRIRDVNAIRSFGYSGVIPSGTDEIIAYQKKVPRFFLKQTPSSEALMMRCFKNVSGAAM